MTKKDKAIDIFQDIAIFEQVSKEADNAKHAPTEATDNEALQQAIDLEHSLRDTFAQAAAAEQEHETDNPTISANNFDALLARIDAAEQEAAAEPANNVIKLFPNKSLRKLSIAASFVAVCAVSLSLFNHLLEPKFVTLSAPEQANNDNAIDFGGLVSERRLAKMVLNDVQDPAARDALLATHQLRTISVAPQQGSLIVQTAQQIDDKMLASWRADPRINSVEVIEFNTNSKIDAEPEARAQD